MIDYILIFPILFAFLIPLFFIPKWIKKANQIGLVWNDMNKISSPRVAGSGGIISVGGFVLGVLVFIAYREFYLHSSQHLLEIYSLLLVIVIIAGVGFIDDLFGWQRGGLSRRSRLIIILFSSIPLVVINAGKHISSLPLFGQVDLGILYPLLIIPLGIIGASTTFNFLAGFNGLEAGQGIILLGAAGIITYVGGNSWLTVVCICMIASLAAFLIYNFCPARVFPGNSITLAIGALFAIISILGDFEKIAVFFFIPYILEFILKSRGKLVKHSFGKPNKDGSIDLLYPSMYGLTHVSIYILKKLHIKSTEKRVVYTIWAFQILIIVIGFILFRRSIFH